MIDYFYTILLGIIQGVTEFWPISSSGHLVIAHELLRFEFADNVSFDVALHLGTLAALLIYFRKDIGVYIVAFFKSFANWNLVNDSNQRLAWYVVVGSIPAGLVGYFLATYIETVLRSTWLVAILLIVVGALLLLAERVAKQNKGLSDLRWGGALLVGLAQALALVPGVSRSGITIITGLWYGLKRRTATRFSFLLSIPAVFGAGVKKMYDLESIGLSGHDWGLLAIGFITAAVIGYAAIRFLLRYVANHSLNVFAYYRFALGAVLILYLMLS